MAFSVIGQISTKDVNAGLVPFIITAKQGHLTLNEVLTSSSKRS
jgi:hypothetical protein